MSRSSAIRSSAGSAGGPLHTVAERSGRTRKAIAAGYALSPSSHRYSPATSFRYVLTSASSNCLASHPVSAHRRVATAYRSVGRNADARSAERAASIVERAKAIDREIEAAGGLPEFWKRHERAKRDRGESYR